MYLKSIEIHGFKSFANKIIFEFPHGITGIVGPNGSGKSNIGDAVRWVLGEQSARQLRGTKMEDVIFSGTETRKPLGYAYVAILFDNKDRIIALDYDEVKVARRVYRSGESEYLINGSTCRRRDILEIFYDTGIGKEGYSIIGQGQVEKILSGKIEDSRELFDEAAGIAKYKKNRSVTEKSLEQEHHNLERVTDVLSELSERVGPLEQESKKAKKFLHLKELEKELDIHLFLYDFEKNQKELAENKRQYSIIIEDLEAAAASCENIKKQNNLLLEKGEAIADKLSSLEEDRNSLFSQKEEVDNKKMMLRHHIDSNERMLSHYEELLLQSMDDREERIRTKGEQQASLRKEEEAIASLKEKRDALVREKEALRQKQQQVSHKLSLHKEALFSSMDDQLDTKEKLSRYGTMEEQLIIRNAEYNSRLIALQSDREQYGTKNAMLEQEMESTREAYEASQQRVKEKEKEQQAAHGETEELRKRLEEDKQIFLRSRSRYETLAGVTERYDGYNQSIRHIMEQKKKNPGIIGVVADILEMDKSYETAIEIALGGALQNVVTTDNQVAKKMIAWLKENRCGRATFLPLPNIRKRNSGIHPSVLEDVGVVGIASRLVRAEPRFDALIESLLGRTVVVDTIEHALALSKKNNYNLRIVTLGGELLNPGGSITGGAFRHAGNLLGRKREVEESREQMKQAEKSCRELQKRLQILLEQTADREKTLQEYKKESDGLRLKLHDLGYQIPDLLEKEKELKGIIQALKEEHEVLKEQLSDIRMQKEVLEKSQVSHEKIHEKNNNLIERLETNLKELGEEWSKKDNEDNQLMLGISKAEQQMEFYQSDCRRLDGEIVHFQEEIQKKEKEKQILREQNSAAKKDILAVEEDWKALSGKMQEISEKIEEEKRNQQAISKKQQAMFRRLEEENERRLVLEKENTRLLNRQERLEAELEALVDYMWDTYELTYHFAGEFRRYDIDDASAGEYRRQKKDILKEIRQLGNVNVNAIEEYQSVGERYDFLKSQYEDIRATEEKLNQMILDLNGAMKEQFARSFQEIRETFATVFRDLFEGGTADLELMDADNMLECGIRIVAQPPGKKLQNILLLSGGERALTAIALLFAIQKLKPSPFCLLDEIEAALDDANIIRFSKYLKKLSEDTQFIIITHRRGTMSAAEALYGITMQEKGVSTLISVDLIDKELDA